MKPSIDPLAKLFIMVSLFAVAMGFLESAVVVYLREIYYPGGFHFPLAPIDRPIAITEIIREAATMIMLVIIGYLAGKNLSSRFAWFLYSFAIWDIFYYVFLKFLLNWPESLMTDDILFLIPVTWVGPVISPVIVSLSMIGLAIIILVFDFRGIKTRISKWEWLLLISGSVILILAFTWDYSRFVLNEYSFAEIWTLPNKQELYDYAGEYVPFRFNWFLFITGQLVIIAGILMVWARLKKVAIAGNNGFNKSNKN
jgi:hypothetical protein